MQQSHKLKCFILTAVCIGLTTPVYAGYQTVYVPDNQTYVGGANGQTIIVQGTAPTQTIVIKETAPQTIVVQDSSPTYVQETTTYIPQTAYVSDASLVAAGVTGLVGGILIGSSIKHHDKPHFRPTPPLRHHPKPMPHHGRR